MTAAEAIRRLRTEANQHPDTVYAMALELAIAALERKREFTKIIAVDFDGTLCKNRYPEIGAPTTLLKRAIEEQKNGACIILWTCRKGTRLDEAVNWSAEHGLIFDAVNANLPENIVQYGGIDTRKVFADEYWDDRSVPVMLPKNRCPFCGSKRVFALRIDSDWGSGIGDYYPVNPINNYDDSDIDAERDDISVYHCRKCGRYWDAD